MSKLREWRDAQEINQETAAEMFKISVSHLSMIETGARIPSLSVALEIQKKTDGVVTPASFYETDHPK